MKIQKDILALYTIARAKGISCIVGRSAAQCLHAAKTIHAFAIAESAGLVRLRQEEEWENYFDAFGAPEPYERNGHLLNQQQTAEELEKMLERDGVWWSCAEWFDGDEWQMADSCGMHAGYKDPLSPWENGYIVGEMRSALDALEMHASGTANEANESFSAACRDLVTV